MTYSQSRKEYLSEHPFCEARVSGCTHTATDIHHKAGRFGDRLTDKSEFLAVCRNCHRWIHDNDKLSREKGWLKNTYRKRLSILEEVKQGLI